MVLFWFIAFILFVVIELMTVNLVTIWFAVGSVAAMISTILTDSFIIQTLVFIVVSLICLLVTKPLVKKFKGFNIQPTNSDRVIGKTGEVTKKIEKNKYGEVKVLGNTWTASSDEEIKVGTKIKVLEIEGVKLIVKKEEE